MAANLELLLTSEAVFGLCTVSVVIPGPLILGCAFAGRLNRFFALGWAVILGCWAAPPMLCLPGLLAAWFSSPILLRPGGLSGFLCALSVVFGRFTASCFPILEVLMEGKNYKKIRPLPSQGFQSLQQQITYSLSYI